MMLAFLLLLGGCNETEIYFSHANHIKRGLNDCNTCHNYEEDLTPKWPKMAKCLMCHKKNCDSGNAESCKFCHTGSGKKLKVVHHIPKKYGDLKFTHKVHLENKIECLHCHKGITTSLAITQDLIPDMLGTCIPCHKQRGESQTACSVCHKHIKNDRMPLYHEDQWVQHKELNWIKKHGREFYYNQDYCKRCHNDLDKCVACHQDQKPKNHNNAWRRKTHGFAASWDRKKCSVCHQEDFCERCHSSTKPLNHNAVWAGKSHGSAALGNQNQCAVCHQEDFCIRCHSTTKPVSHNAAWREKTHGFAASGNRNQCSACHQEDFCIRCHTTTKPLNHTSVWGGKGTKNLHCRSCHLPATDACSACHLVPDHSSASPSPHLKGHGGVGVCVRAGCHAGWPGNPPHSKLFGVSCTVCHVK